MNQFDWPTTKNKKETMGASKNNFLIFKHKVPPVWPTYIHVRKITFSKACGIKVTCYWELFGKHVKKLGNSLL
jgi:hypothetical protein